MSQSVRDTFAYMSDEALAEALRMHGHAIWCIQAEMERRAEREQTCNNASPCANEDSSPQPSPGQPDDLMPKTPSI